MTALKKGDVVLVTGATSGLGRAVAERLASSGYRVYGTGRNPKTDESPSFTLIRMDVTDEKSVRAAVQEILEKEGRIDAVLCNAGSGIAGSVEETPIQEVRYQMETVFFGTLRTLQAVLPAMRKKGGGVVLCVSSIAGRAAVPFQGFYSASKYALEGLVESLRYEVRPYNIRCALIEPGDFRTGFTDARKKTASLESPYSEAMARALGVMEKDERSGFPPARMAELVERLLSKKKLRVRYTVGPAFERFAAGIKRVLPSRVYESLFALYYRV